MFFFPFKSMLSFSSDYNFFLICHILLKIKYSKHNLISQERPFIYILDDQIIFSDFYVYIQILIGSLHTCFINLFSLYHVIQIPFYK